MPKIDRPQKYEYRCDRCKRSEFSDSLPHLWTEFVIPATSPAGTACECVMCQKCRDEVVNYASGDEPKILPRPFDRPFATNGPAFCVPNPTPIWYSPQPESPCGPLCCAAAEMTP